MHEQFYYTKGTKCTCKENKSVCIKGEKCWIKM